MFIKIGSYHNDRINDRQKNQNITVTSFFIYKIQSDCCKKQQQSIHRRKHMKSLCKSALKNHNNSSLSSTAKTLNS